MCVRTVARALLLLLMRTNDHKVCMCVCVRVCERERQRDCVCESLKGRRKLHVSSVGVCWNVLQCVAVCCSVLQCAAMRYSVTLSLWFAWSLMSLESAHVFCPLSCSVF